MPYGKSYDKEKAPGVPMNQRRKAAGEMVSYNNTKLRPRKKGGDGHLGTVKKMPKP